jgi:hypothetical protein
MIIMIRIDVWDGESNSGLTNERPAGRIQPSRKICAALVLLNSFSNTV